MVLLVVFQNGLFLPLLLEVMVGVAPRCCCGDGRRLCHVCLSRGNPHHYAGNRQSAIGSSVSHDHCQETVRMGHSIDWSC